MILTSNGTRLKSVRTITRNNKKASSPVIDYIQDLDLIISAFYHDYKIKANELLSLKGREFLVLLNGLSDKNLLMKVVCVRGMSESELSAEYKELKKNFRLNQGTECVNELESFASAMAGRKEYGNWTR
ncbi:hypothetical protein HLA87_02460 [Mycoplasma miroungigenitalium]|uniref:Uncharacterized protein n=1 Tax=Mycoplasma miroungigenitalium TaxID=754515 RepID=A0A6M4JC27_9MOLU|nr:Gp15 family bacteriophage protein [Mycoplasma miroungigenitalium]QJR43637.1 hypothetical protein HLA87_02460 [Mycoplasma miroungigenitalium]